MAVHDSDIKSYTVTPEGFDLPRALRLLLLGASRFVVIATERGERERSGPGVISRRVRAVSKPNQMRAEVVKSLPLPADQYKRMSIFGL